MNPKVITSDMVPIVIDEGSKFIKAGFGGEDKPVKIFPNLCGEYRNPPPLYSVGDDFQYWYAGDEAYKKRSLLRIRYPIEHGRVRTHMNWINREKILKIIFRDHLKVIKTVTTWKNYTETIQEDHPVMVLESSLTLKNDREKMASKIFEYIEMPGLYIANSASLALLESGKYNGIVVEIGGGVTNVVPVYQGYAVHHGIVRVEVGGEEITDALKMVLMQLHGLQEIRRYMSFYPFDDCIEQIKKQFCYVSQDFLKEQNERNFSEDTKFEFVYNEDGSDDKKKKIVTLGKELFQIPEFLFDPSRRKLPSRVSDLGKFPELYDRGIHDYLYESIMKCEEDMRPLLLENVLLTGGGSSFRGLSERLTKEMLSHHGIKVKVLTSKETDRRIGAWKGGSLVCSNFSTFKDMWISQDEYDDAGTTIVHRKCF